MIVFPSARKPLAIAAALLVLSGCQAIPGGGGSRGPTAGAQGMSPSNPAQPAAEGELPPNILNIPDLPVPPGAQVLLTDTVIVGDDTNWTGQIVMDSEGYGPVQIVEYIRTNMPKYGWSETAIVRSRRTSMTYVKGGRFATVRIQPIESGVEIDVVVSPARKPNESRPSIRQAPLPPATTG